MNKIMYILLFSFLTLSVSYGNENVFNINGQYISLTDSELKEFRDKWQGSNIIKTSTLLNKSDIQWIFDFISLREYVLNKKCNKLILKKTRKFDSRKDKDEVGSHIKAGKFEYMWEVKACSKTRKYRIVNEKGTSDFIVYPLSLKN